MAISRFTARDLTQSVRRVGDARANFLVNAIFKQGGLHPTDVIDFGVMKINKRVAVYQRPGGMAVPVNKSTGSAKTVRAPKIREKVVFDENFGSVLNPALGGYAGPYTDPNSQLAERVTIEQAKLRMRAEMAIELQAAQALQTGTVTFTYEDGGTETVTFGYTGNGTSDTGDAYTVQPKLTGTNLWTATGSNPRKDIERLINQTRRTSPYGGGFDTIMGETAWANFIDNASVTAQFDNRNLSVGNMAPIMGDMFKGVFGGSRIFVYSNGYYDNAGTLTEMWDPKKIVVLPRQEMGVLTIEHGAVFDKPDGEDRSRWIQTDWFSKMVNHDDPPVDEIIVETRPLVLIKDADAIRVLQVIA